LIDIGHGDIKTKTIQGLTLMEIAAFEGDVELVKWLVEERNADVMKRIDNGWTALHCAASAGKLHVVQYLMKTGKAQVDAKDIAEQTAVDLAAQFHHWDVVAELLNHVWNADPDCSGEDVSRLQR
jgi:ankyrin repeat protein